MTSSVPAYDNIWRLIDRRTFLTSSILIVVIVTINRFVDGDNVYHSSSGNSYRSHLSAAWYDERPESTSSVSNRRRFERNDYIDDDDDEAEAEIRPVFLPTSQNVTVWPGDKASMLCRVEFLGSKTVTWRRLGEIHPMTIGMFTFVSDTRISAEHNPRTDDWILSIDPVRPSDEGTYQCQINSKDDQTNFRNVHLHVTSSRHIGGAGATIDGPVLVTGNSSVERGQPIHLVCNATTPVGRAGPGRPSGEAVAPQWVEWIKDDRLLTNDPDQGLIVTQRIERFNIGRSDAGRIIGVVSVLAIRKSKASDGGEYRCRTSENDVGSIRVSVLNASPEKRRIMAEKVVGAGAASGAAVDAFSFVNFLVITTLLHWTLPLLTKCAR